MFNCSAFNVRLPVIGEDVTDPRSNMIALGAIRFYDLQLGPQRNKERDNNGAVFLIVNPES